jgi:hypothetical protein
MVEIFHDTSLEGLAYKCQELSLQLPSQEAGMVRCAAKSFQNAVQYLNDREFFYYRRAIASGCTSIELAKLTANTDAETKYRQNNSFRNMSFDTWLEQQKASITQRLRPYEELGL